MVSVPMATRFPTLKKNLAAMWRRPKVYKPHAQGSCTAAPSATAPSLCFWVDLKGVGFKAHYDPLFCV